MNFEDEAVATVSIKFFEAAFEQDIMKLACRVAWGHLRGQKRAWGLNNDYDRASSEWVSLTGTVYPEQMDAEVGELASYRISPYVTFVRFTAFFFV